MQKFGLNTVFKLSLVLLAFKAYSKTEGHPANNMASWELLTEMYTGLFTEMKCASNVTEGLTPCVSHGITTADEKGTEGEKCKNLIQNLLTTTGPDERIDFRAIIVSIKDCIRNGLEACDVDLFVYSLFTENLNKEIHENMCESIDLSGEAHTNNVTVATS